MKFVIAVLAILATTSIYAYDYNQDVSTRQQEIQQDRQNKDSQFQQDRSNREADRNEDLDHAAPARDRAR